MFSAKVKQNKAATTHTTLISEGCEIQGDLMLECNMQVDGCLQGNICSTHTVTINPSGRVQGIIYARHLIVKGLLEGEFYAEQVDIMQSGVLSGNIHSDNLCIETGGRFTGEVLPTDAGQEIGNNKRALPLNGTRGKVMGITTA